MFLVKETLTPDQLMTFEKYFDSDSSIPLNDCYFYFQMLRQTKDFSDSKHVLSRLDSTKFDMVYMRLKREGNDITFDGAVSNGIENRLVDGLIKQNGKRYYVLTHIWRIHPLVPNNIKEYYVYDTYKIIKDKIYQETMYDESLEYRKENSENSLFKQKIDSFDMESFYKFREQVGKTR